MASRRDEHQSFAKMLTLTVLISEQNAKDVNGQAGFILPSIYHPFLHATMSLTQDVDASIRARELLTEAIREGLVFENGMMRSMTRDELARAAERMFGLRKWRNGEERRIGDLQAIKGRPRSSSRREEDGSIDAAAADGLDSWGSMSASLHGGVVEGRGRYDVEKREVCGTRSDDCLLPSPVLLGCLRDCHLCCRSRFMGSLLGCSRRAWQMA